MTTEEDAASLVGPAHTATEEQSLVGMPQLTPEEAAAIATKEELGLYSHHDIIDEGGRKIRVKTGTIGEDPLTGDALVKDHSGKWLRPSDPGYDERMRTEGLQAMSADASPGALSQGETPAQKTEHEELTASLTTMLAQDAGSTHPHEMIDVNARQRILSGSASTLELQKLLPKVATIDNFPIAGAADINPELLGQMHAPPRVTGAGADAAYAAAMARKKERNDQFTMQLAKIEKDKG